MTTFGKGYRSRTRRRLAAKKRSKFKVEPYMQGFKPGEKVAIKHEPASHGGMPHIRFKGKIATVKSKRGAAYVLSLTMGKKEKQIIAGPEHLKLIKQ